ncbi:Oxygen-dependent choline dehydrogenase 3 [Colletotrichum truncatum]|uniref:Oxygen-dependent choline dehydrogenase 3 n=1 Tax=Colletotrichum truncatum TaxID=5467 RepID=A0ACC3YLS6_COLTU|nr:Oxygen-dependent choline dehydrogenase 3 [Colletotrichum truncatum]KAF6791469.1 Oxygen-dependent choline dehydrogenase 3 [Colletotrichum truncatum]
MLSTVWDYIIVGGGLAGSVISSRMLEYNSSLSILLIEAGEDTRSRTDILYVNATNLMGGELDWQYPTKPISGLNNRTIVFNQGKGLGGGAAINACGYTRGPKVDYDEWAELIGDPRWSYENQLPYMKKAEDWSNSDNTAQHGNGGPLHVASVSSTGRAYPLRDAVAKGWDELGIPELPNLDSNAGNNIGRAELTETRRNGLRELPPVIYPLKGITVLTDTLVEKILLKKNCSDGELHATGVQLANGTQISSKNVISAAGAYRSPQLLMLSGIGDAVELEKHNISVQLNLPEVGKNLADHISFYQWWQLKNPEKGYALGSSNPLFAQPEFGLGYPIDWVTSTGVNKTGLADAIAKDEGAAPDSATHSLLKNDRTFLETFVIYQAYNPANPAVPMDGSHIYTNLVSFLPTSRGTVSLSSSNPTDAPVIDLNYLATEVDRYVYREGVRQITKLMLDTSFGKEYIAGEAAPNNFAPASLEDTDEYLDARLAQGGLTTWHPHGTCAMGKVVDSEFNVKGVKGLRIVDASVLPVAMAAHLMAPLYAMAEQAAAIITGNA